MVTERCFLRYYFPQHYRALFLRFGSAYIVAMLPVFAMLANVSGHR